VTRDDARINAPNTATAAKPALRKKRKEGNDDDDNNKNKNKTDDVLRGTKEAEEASTKKIKKNVKEEEEEKVKARKAHLLHQYDTSKTFRTQNFNEGSDACASYFPLDPPSEESVRERIEEEKQVEHELSSFVFIEVDGDEFLPEEQVVVAIEQARTLPVAEGLNVAEYTEYIGKIYACAVEEYKKKENERAEELASESESESESQEEFVSESDEELSSESDEELSSESESESESQEEFVSESDEELSSESDEELSSESESESESQEEFVSESDEELSSESERAEEEKKDGFLFFPISVIGLKHRAILHVFDNYPAHNDVLSISEANVKILQEKDTLAVLGDSPYTQDLYAWRTSKEKDFPPEVFAQKTETLLATEALHGCIKEIVPMKMVRFQDVAPVSDGTRRKKAKSHGCKPPEVMHEAGVESFVQHFSSHPDKKTTLNLVRAKDTSKSFFAAFAVAQKRNPAKAMKLFKMKENVDKNTEKLSTGKGNVGTYVMREGGKKGEYRYTWYFILPSPTLSTKALTVAEQISALRDTLSVINEFLRLLGAKPWGVNVNPLTLKRGSGNLRREEEVSVRKYRDGDETTRNLDASDAAMTTAKK